MKGGTRTPGRTGKSGTPWPKVQGEEWRSFNCEVAGDLESIGTGVWDAPELSILQADFPPTWLSLHSREESSSWPLAFQSL